MASNFLITAQKRRPSFFFLGAHPAIDFANTLVPPPGPDIEFLQSWQDVINWLTEADLSGGQSLDVSIAGQAQALESVRDLRHAWKSALDEIMTGHGVPTALVDRFNDILELDTYTDVLRSEGKKGIRVHRSLSLLGGKQLVLAILARSMADFLVNAEFRYLRRCANTRTCSLIFYDTTKNHQRLWCSNSMCGNRHKVAEFRRRQRRVRKKKT